jgi:hypothetical protein
LVRLIRFGGYPTFGGGFRTVDAVEAVLVDQGAAGCGEAHAQRAVARDGGEVRAALAAAADGYENLEVRAAAAVLQRGEGAEAALRAVDFDLRIGIFVRKLPSLVDHRCKG